MALAQAPRGPDHDAAPLDVPVDGAGEVEPDGSHLVAGHAGRSQPVKAPPLPAPPPPTTLATAPPSGLQVDLAVGILEVLGGILVLILVVALIGLLAVGPRRGEDHPIGVDAHAPPQGSLVCAP